MLRPPQRGAPPFPAPPHRLLCFCSRDEVKSKWSISDFIRAFIKFHGHVYLSRSLEKLEALREKLEEQFQVEQGGVGAGLGGGGAGGGSGSGAGLGAGRARLIAPSPWCVQRLILQKAFSTQQLVHITVINLFELHHLRDLTEGDPQQERSSQQDLSWLQLLGLFSEDAHSAPLTPPCLSPR